MPLGYKNAVARSYLPPPLLKAHIDILDRIQGAKPARKRRSRIDF